MNKLSSLACVTVNDRRNDEAICLAFEDGIRKFPLDFFHQRKVRMMVADKVPDRRSVSLVFLEGAGKECPWCMVDVEEDLYVQDVAAVVGGGKFRRFMRAVIDGDMKKAEQARFSVVDLFFEKSGVRTVGGVMSAKEVAEECFDKVDDVPEAVLTMAYVKRCALAIARINKDYDEGGIVLVSAEECAVCLADLVEDAIQEELNYYRDSEEEDLRQDEDYQALLKLEKKARLRRSEIGGLPQAKKDDDSRRCLSCAAKGDGSDVGSRDKVPHEGKAKLSKLCLWSFICGVFSILLFPLVIPEVLGLLLGIGGLRRCKRDGHKGKWMGVAGIVASCLACGLFLILMTVPDGKKDAPEDSATPAEEAPVSACADKLASSPAPVKAEDGKFDFSEADRAEARRKQAEAGTYSEEDIMKLDVSEDERQILLKLNQAFIDAAIVKIVDEANNLTEDESEELLIEAGIKTDKKAEAAREKKLQEEEERKRKEREEELAVLTPHDRALFVFDECQHACKFFLKKAVTENMHDPDSFEFVSLDREAIKVGDHQYDVQAVYRFRGKNAMGTKVLNSMRFKFSTEKENMYDIKEPTLGN